MNYNIYSILPKGKSGIFTENSSRIIATITIRGIEGIEQIKISKEATMRKRKAKKIDSVQIRLNLKNGNFLQEFAYAEDRVLNSQIEEYILDQIEFMSPKSEIEMEFAAEEDEAEIFRNALINTFNHKITKTKKDLKRKYISALIMLFIGVMLMAAYFFHTYFFLLEISLVASWVFLWRAVELYFFEIQKMKISMLKYKKLSNTCIKYNPQYN